jgi:hypothetical protein
MPNRMKKVAQLTPEQLEKRRASGRARAKKFAASSPTKRAQDLGWRPSSRRQELMSTNAKRLGYTVLSAGRLRNPRFVCITPDGKRHTEHLALSENQLLLQVQREIRK